MAILRTRPGFEPQTLEVLPMMPALQSAHSTIEPLNLHKLSILLDYLKMMKSYLKLVLLIVHKWRHTNFKIFCPPLPPLSHYNSSFT